MPKLHTIVIPKGTYLFNGSNIPQASKSLRQVPTWFTYNPYTTLHYASLNLDEDQEGTITLYRTERDIAAILLGYNEESNDRPGGHTYARWSRGGLPVPDHLKLNPVTEWQYVSSLVEQERFCELKDVGPFNGWQVRGNQQQVMLCNPHQWLTHVADWTIVNRRFVHGFVTKASTRYKQVMIPVTVQASKLPIRERIAAMAEFLAQVPLDLLPILFTTDTIYYQLDSSLQMVYDAHYYRYNSFLQTLEQLQARVRAQQSRRQRQPRSLALVLPIHKVVLKPNIVLIGSKPYQFHTESDATSQPPVVPAASSTFSFANPAASSSSVFSFANPPASFSFANPATSSSNSGFSFANPATSSSNSGFSFANPATSSSNSGFSFANPASSSSSNSGFSFANPVSPPSPPSPLSLPVSVSSFSFLNPSPSPHIFASSSVPQASPPMVVNPPIPLPSPRAYHARKQNQSAVRLQAAVRGHLARKQAKQLRQQQALLDQVIQDLSNFHL